MVFSSDLVFLGGLILRGLSGCRLVRICVCVLGEFLVGAYVWCRFLTLCSLGFGVV